MAETLILNPKRRKARRNPSAKQKANWARFARAARARSANPKRRRAARRRSNPAMVSQLPEVNPRRRRSRRRSNPALRTYRAASRRRSNPIAGLPSTSTILSMAKEGAIMGFGAVAVDVGYGYISRWLPPSLQTTGGLNAGAAVKVALTVAIGTLLSRVTRGASRKAALGSLVVQARDIAANLIPAGLPLAGRVGYYSPAMIAQGTPRVGLPRGAMGAYIPGSASTLARYMPNTGGPAGSPLLSGRSLSARSREGHVR